MVGRTAHEHERRHPRLWIALAAVVMLFLSACGGSLTDAARIWCADSHVGGRRVEVYEAALKLGLVTVPAPLNRDSFVQVYWNSWGAGLPESYGDDPDFVRLCRQVIADGSLASELRRHGLPVVEAQSSGYLTSDEVGNCAFVEGRGKAFHSAAKSLGIPIVTLDHAGAAWAWGMWSWDRETGDFGQNPDYIRACNAAFELREKG